MDGWMVSLHPNLINQRERKSTFCFIPHMQVVWNFTRAICQWSCASPVTSFPRKLPSSRQTKCYLQHVWAAPWPAPVRSTVFPQPSAVQLCHFFLSKVVTRGYKRHLKQSLIAAEGTFFNELHDTPACDVLTSPCTPPLGSWRWMKYLEKNS